MTVLTFDVDRHRREKQRRLERRNEYLEAERDRLHVLLADALIVAAGNDCRPLELLQVLADRRRFNLARAAMHDRPCVPLDELATLLRETAP